MHVMLEGMISSGLVRALKEQSVCTVASILLFYTMGFTISNSAENHGNSII